MIDKKPNKYVQYCKDFVIKEDYIGIPRKQFIQLLLVSGLILMIPLILLKVPFPDYFAIDNERSGWIGDALGGITSPFIGLLGTVLVYAAFQAQIRANSLIQQQFQEQGNEQLIYRLIDGIQARIINYKKEYGGVMREGHAFCEVLSEELTTKVSQGAYRFAQTIFVESVEDLKDEDFDLMKNAVTNSPISVDADKLRKASYRDRRDFLKEYKKYVHDFIADDIFKQIGYKRFYNSDVQFQSRFYDDCFLETVGNHNNYYVGYFRMLNAILQQIKKSGAKKQLFANYLAANLTQAEQTIIIIYICTAYSDLSFGDLVLELDIIDFNELSYGFILYPEEDVLREHVMKVREWNRKSAQEEVSLH